MPRILLVEDDPRISEPLVRVLRAEGFAVDLVEAGQDALGSVEDDPPDLVLLDLTLPDVDGLDVCRSLRTDRPGLPIIMLTARSEEVDVIVGLDAGADDYVSKPFRLAELVARIRTRLRAANVSGATPSTLVSGDLRIEAGARRVFLGDDELELTTKEFDLLALLMGSPGIAITRDQIMSAVWDEHWWGSTRTLDTHVSTLRRKIRDDSDPPSRIVTVRGVGFRFEG